MIRVVINLRSLPEEQRRKWRELKREARAARDEVIDAYEAWLEARRRDPLTPAFKFEFREQVWRDIRDWLLLNVFQNKCAYCEAPAVRFRPHTEHFRPKAQVRYRETARGEYHAGKVFDEDGAEIDHPGYFWLAYNWKNLLPSCHYCNAFDGKKDQFPVQNAHVMVKRLTDEEAARLKVRRLRRKGRGDVFYLEPEDLNALEEPLLLNPYVDDPRAHLTFDLSGEAVPRAGSERGRHTIDVFDLNDSELTRARRRAQGDAFDRYMKKMDGTKAGAVAMRSAGEEALAEYRSGEAPYSAAALDFIHRMTRDSPMDPYKTLAEVARMEREEF